MSTDNFLNLNSSKIQTPLSMLTEFRMKRDLVLLHLRTKFELDNSKFAQVRQFKVM